MKQLTKIAAGLAIGLAASGVSAATFELAASNSVSNEAASSGAAVGTRASESITLVAGMPYSVGNRVYLKLSSGATFQDTAYALISSAAAGSKADALTLNGYTKGDSVLEFIVASAVKTGNEFYLSGSTAIKQPVKIGLPKTGPVTVSANAKDNIGDYDATATAGNLFYYANEFSAALEQKADGVIDVNEARLKFDNGVNFDRVGLEIVNAGLDTQVTLDKDDALVITLSGDMSGIGAIVGRKANNGKAYGSTTIDVPNGTATFTISGSDLGNNAKTSALLDITGATSVPLSTRAFKVAAKLNFKTETAVDVLKTADAGSWTINGLQAVISSMSLNTSGFISWLKVANTGEDAVEVYGDIIATLADGTEKKVTAALLGTVDAGGVGTIGEAAFLKALGNPTGLVDANVTVTVTAPNNVVHLMAEKKASDGRVNIPVFYDNTAGGRKWFQ